MRGLPALLVILAAVRTPQSVPRLVGGDYLTEGFMKSMQISRSVERSLEGAPGEVLARIEAGGDEWRLTRGGFTSECGAATIRRDGSLAPEGGSVTVVSSIRFSTTLCGGEPTTFLHVGDHRAWISYMLVGGEYKDPRGAKYIFGSSGVAKFAGRRHTYRVPLEAPSDRLEVDGVLYAWAIEGGLLKIFEFSEAGERAAEPRWALRRMTTNSSMVEGIP
ncbi:MAG: hypothetical protein ACREAA_01390 [Candidatus Polarisedimenticolia bacterium]